MDGKIIMEYLKDNAMKLILFFSLILFCSCKNNDMSKKQEILSHYSAIPFSKLRGVDNNIFNELYENKCRFFPSSLTKFGFSGILIKRKIGYDSLLKQISNLKIDKLPFNHNEKLITPNQAKNDNIDSSRYGFLDLSLDLCDLKDFNYNNSIVYIFDNKRGYFFNNTKIESYDDETKKYLLSEGNHGFTSGAIVNGTDREILFWSIIW